MIGGKLYARRIMEVRNRLADDRLWNEIDASSVL